MGNFNLNKIMAGRRAELTDMLDARERRQAIQQELLAACGRPVISFTLNIVGPVKTFPLAERTFFEGVRLIEEQLRAWKIPVLQKRRLLSHTGNEAFWAAEGRLRFIKEILCLLEENLSFGRLFDIDVIDVNGAKLSRTDLGFAPRRCLLCSQEAFVCSRARSHSVEELLRRECELMEEYFAVREAARLSSLSMQALLYEVSITPKPGLVDRKNTGAHRDMDIFTFEASAVSLNHYFSQFALCGITNSREPFPRIFARLRSLGIQAEEAMLCATGGVNTHKGLIFSLAILNCSLGWLYANEIPYSPQTLLETNRRLVADVLHDFDGVTADNARTSGERLYALYGIRGARGEALDGYQTVLLTALPALRDCLRAGAGLNEAGALTLLHILARSEDTNIISRSSYEEMKEIRARAAKQLSLLEEIPPAERFPAAVAWLETLDREFIERNISPGGSADLLALTLFIYLYEQAEAAGGQPLSQNCTECAE